MTNMSCGVPQGSILGPLLFNIYMLPLAQMIKNSILSYHIYADNTQRDYSPIRTLSKCIEHITDWMTQNFLQLNKQKTEIIVFGAKKDRLNLIAELQSADYKVTHEARNLGVVMDSDLNCNSHITTVIRSAYYHLKNIKD